MKQPKILCLDIETFPLEVYSWGIFETNIAPQNIIKDWSIASWAACWIDNPKNIMYADTRNEKNVRNDKQILKQIHKLMSEADIILGQNSDSFDIKRLNTRFLIHGMAPIKGYRTLDTKKIAKRNFAFTTASLDHMTKSLDSNKKKLKNEGFSLWVRCLNGEINAFKDMEKYNKMDVAATVALYLDLRPWDNTLNFNVYNDDLTYYCNCGNKKFQKRGYSYTAAGKYQRYVCTKCGAWSRGATNLFSKEKRISLGRRN